MINEVKRIFDDIRDAIIEMGGNIDICTSPDDYDSAIKALAGNNAVLFVPVFKSSDVKPDRPTTQMSSNDPTAYPAGWSTPDGLTGKIWMSYTIVGPTSVYVPWTEPLLINGSSEETPDADYDPATTRTFLIYLELPDLRYSPSRPTGGRWDIVNNILEKPITSNILDENGNQTGRITTDWDDNNNHRPGQYTWMSMGTFLFETGELIGEWSDPICINSVRDGIDGTDGRNGVDGQSVEFIYILCRDKEDFETLTTPESINEDGFVPETGRNPDWTNHPQSIDPINYRVEAMCTRKRSSSGEWGPFIGPVYWAVWGEDGTDGDGVEYIFRVATRGDVNEIDRENGIYTLATKFWPPTCAGTPMDGCASGFIDVAEDSETYPGEAAAMTMYNTDEFVPGEQCQNAIILGWDRNWTDEPLDVSISQPFEFCSIRKYNGDTGQWSWFSEPVLWNRYWGANSPIFTSFAFTRSKLKLGNMEPEGGSILNPLPDPKDHSNIIDGQTVTERIVWFDTVPNGNDFPNDPTLGVSPVWMTTRIFGSVDPDAELQDTGWTSPTLISDNKYFQVEYSASSVVNENTELPKFDDQINNTYPFINKNDPEGVDESAWRDYCTTHNLGVWGDENDIVDPTWMATCQFLDGKWTEWNIAQIKGENGKSIWTSYAFTKAPEGVDISSYTVSGVNWIGNTPIPTTITPPSGTIDPRVYTWTDAPPITNPGEVTWETIGRFQDDGVRSQVGTWSSPRLLQDTKDFEVMYSPVNFENASIAKAAIPLNFKKIGIEIDSTWKALAKANGWYDERSDFDGQYVGATAIWKAEITGRNNQFSDAHWILTKVAGEQGEPGTPGTPGNGILRITVTYKWSNDGINHPTSGWSDNIAAFDPSYPYLWTKTVIVYTDGSPDYVTYTVTRQGTNGSPGSNGAKLRMRNWSATAYSSPDSEGQNGWLSGNSTDPDYNNDVFYDIAIWPINANSITIENAASNAPRLWLCKKRLTYAKVAELVQANGADNVYPGSVLLNDYFVQAQGWDFLATNVLLANKINANDIFSENLSVNQLHTTGDDGHIDIMGNDIALSTSSGAKGCLITGDALTEIENYSGNNGVEQIVWKSPFGLSEANSINTMGFEGDVQVGSFSIDSLNSGESYALTFENGLGNGLAVQLYLLTNATSTVTPWSMSGTLVTGIYVKEASSGRIVANNICNNINNNVVLTEQNAHSESEQEVVLYSSDNILYVYQNNNLLENYSLNAGNYILCLNYRLELYPSDFPSGSLPSRGYILQTSHAPLKLTKVSSGSGTVTAEDVQFTEIGANGFQHILDQNNYFRVITETDVNDNKTLKLEFLSNGTYGLQITKDGIKYRNGNSWSNWTTP